MDLPITPKFFKKLEFFQELKRLDARNAGHEEWDMEKEFLIWAHKNHFHLGSFLNTQRVISILEECKKFTLQQLNEHVSKMMQNLEEHGWSFCPNRAYDTSIKITQAGMLMGETIYDASQKTKIFFFHLFSYLSWFILFATFLALFLGIAKLIIEIF